MINKTDWRRQIVIMQVLLPHQLSTRDYFGNCSIIISHLLVVVTPSITWESKHWAMVSHAKFHSPGVALCLTTRFCIPLGLYNIYTVLANILRPQGHTETGYPLSTPHGCWKMVAYRNVTPVFLQLRKSIMSTSIWEY